jgi:hypothetical protein
LAALMTVVPARADTVSLDKLDLTVATQGWGKPSADKSVGGNPLTINGTTFDHGFGTHAVGTLAVVLDGHGKRFATKVGLDDETEGKGAVVFRLADELGRALLETPIMLPKADPQTIDIDITGIGTLYLLTDDSNDSNSWDHADWVDASFTYSDVAPHTVKSDHPVIVMQYAPNGWIKVDDTDPNVMYTGDWGSHTGDPCYHRTEHHPNGAKLGFTADFRFLGSQARFYAFKRSDLGRAEIYLDGSFRASVDMHSFDPVYDQTLFESEQLPYGEHWLTVRTTGSNIVVDAFGYRTPASTAPGGAAQDPGGAAPPEDDKSGCRVAACGAGASRWPALAIVALSLGLAARRRRARSRRPSNGAPGKHSVTRRVP